MKFIELLVYSVIAIFSMYLYDLFKGDDEF